MEIGRRQAWIEAARPRTLPAAVAPVLVGSGLAGADGVFRWDAFVAALIGALAIQVAANFANDASDAKRGADVDRVGPPRMVSAGIVTARAMWTATWSAVAVATATGIWLYSIAGWPVLAIGAASILAMLGYVGGPVPYGYRALGEVSVFVFFGLVATVGTRFVHDRSAPADAWWLGAVMGCLAAAILVANNLRDIDTDRAVDKRTLAVVLGLDRTRRLYTLLLVTAFLLILVSAVVGITPPLTGLAVVFFPFTRPLIRAAWNSTSPASLISLLGGTARLQLLVGISLALSAAASH